MKFLPRAGWSCLVVSLVLKYLFSVKIEGLWTEMGGDIEQGITVGWWEMRETGWDRIEKKPKHSQIVLCLFFSDSKVSETGKSDAGEGQIKMSTGQKRCQGNREAARGQNRADARLLSTQNPKLQYDEPSGNASWVAVSSCVLYCYPGELFCRACSVFWCPEALTAVLSRRDVDR